MDRNCSITTSGEYGSIEIDEKDFMLDEREKRCGTAIVLIRSPEDRRRRRTNKQKRSSGSSISTFQAGLTFSLYTCVNIFSRQIPSIKSGGNLYSS